MPDWLSIAGRILSVLLSVSGCLVVIAAPRIVDRTGTSFGEGERERRILSIKLRGLLFAIPGFLLVLVFFRT